MNNNSFGRRSINLNSLNDISFNQGEIFCKWIRGLSIIILFCSIIIYILKSFFSSLTSGIFTVKIEDSDFQSSDTHKQNYSYDFSYSEDNNAINHNLNDNEFIFEEKKYAPYLKNFNLTSYLKNKNKRKKEQNNLYKLFKFDEVGEDSSILIDYSSSLPHYPLFSTENDKCFIRGEIISCINNIDNLTCIDISGIIHDDMDFFVRLSLLEKSYSEIKLFIFKEINIKSEFERKDGKHNVIFYEKNDTKKNVRYCSTEFKNFSKNYKNMPKNYLPVIQISWPKKNKYFCIRNIRLFYEK